MTEQMTQRLKSLTARGLLCTVLVGGLSACRQTTSQTLAVPPGATEDMAMMQPPSATSGQVARHDDWQPAVAGPDSGEGTRGFTSAKVYAAAASSVVIVKLADSHGSGFLLTGNEGWIVTNHHVIESAKFDPEYGGPVADILYGHMVDGWMQLEAVPAKAVIYRSDKAKDLALLKLVDIPPALATVAGLTLAPAQPGPGEECVSIGHPAAGSLWSVRTGEVTGSGIWPDERIEIIMSRISASSKDKKGIEQILAAQPKLKVYYTNVGVNPGDSGGPLFNAAGEVIGVSFAIPAFSEDVRQGTISYHITTGELRDFIAQLPEAPELNFEPWPDMAYGTMADNTGDGKPDTIVFSADGESVGAMLVDVDQDSNYDSARPKETWDYELAVLRLPSPMAFYDTDNDGQMDRLRTDTDGDGQADHEFRFIDGRWVYSRSATGDLVDARAFTDLNIRKTVKLMLK